MFIRRAPRSLPAKIQTPASYLSNRQLPEQFGSFNRIPGNKSAIAWAATTCLALSSDQADYKTRLDNIITMLQNYGSKIENEIQPNNIGRSATDYLSQALHEPIVTTMRQYI